MKSRRARRVGECSNGRAWAVTVAGSDAIVAANREECVGLEVAEDVAECAKSDMDYYKTTTRKKR